MTSSPPERVGAPRCTDPDASASRQLRTVRNLATVRWAAIVWAAIQVSTYYLPYPAGVYPWARSVMGGGRVIAVDLAGGSS